MSTQSSLHQTCVFWCRHSLSPQPEPVPTPSPGPVPTPSPGPVPTPSPGPVQTPSPGPVPGPSPMPHPTTPPVERSVDRLCTDLQSTLLLVLLYKASLIRRIRHVHLGGVAAVSYFLGKKGWTKLANPAIIMERSVRYA